MVKPTYLIDIRTMFTSQTAKYGLDDRCSILAEGCPDQFPFLQEFFTGGPGETFTTNIHFMGQKCTFRPTKRECGVYTVLA
jgi:hypothetical protein